MGNADRLIVSASNERRSVICKSLRTLPNLQVLEDGQGAQLFSAVRDEQIQLVLLEDRHFGVHLLETIDQLREPTRCVQVIVLATAPDQTTIDQYMDSGATACIDSRLLAETLLPTVQTLRYIIAPPMGVALRTCWTRTRQQKLNILSPRESEIFRLLAEGRTAKEIGLACQISVKTVDTHRRNLMEKLGMDRIAQLTRLAIQCGVVYA